jgi:hypothetical protein
MDDEHVLAFVEAVHGAHVDAVHSFAANAALVDDIGQLSVLSAVRGDEERKRSEANNQFPARNAPFPSASIIAYRSPPRKLGPAAGSSHALIWRVPGTVRPFLGLMPESGPISVNPKFLTTHKYVHMNMAGIAHLQVPNFDNPDPANFLKIDFTMTTIPRDRPSDVPQQQ